MSEESAGRSLRPMARMVSSWALRVMVPEGFRAERSGESERKAWRMSSASGMEGAREKKEEGLLYAKRDGGSSRASGIF